MGDSVFMAGDTFLFVSIWSFVFSTIATVVVSLLTEADPPEKLEGLVYGSVVTRGIEQQGATQ